MTTWRELSSDEKRCRINKALRSGYGLLAYIVLFVGVSGVFGILEGDVMRLIAGGIGGALGTLIVFYAANKMSCGN